MDRHAYDDATYYNDATHFKLLKAITLSWVIRNRGG